ncbi:MAG: hypothetical protein LBQ66_03120 [Planctomycetaceae bacterium]|jgi:hypothetical protein|nr:hypothetical protein [Planctomycetaceae bacterium]
MTTNKPTETKEHQHRPQRKFRLGYQPIVPADWDGKLPLLPTGGTGESGRNKHTTILNTTTKDPDPNN